MTDENTDGNLVRTALLYGLRLTQGVRVEPWRDGVSIGAVRDGGCLQVHLHADSAWSGRLVFDTLRHRWNLRLPVDYPRLNQWPEWFPHVEGHQYALVGGDFQGGRLDGADLAAGIQVHQTPDREYRYRLSPV